MKNSTVPVIHEEISSRRFIPRKKPPIQTQQFDVETLLVEPAAYSYPYLETELELIKAKRVTTFNNGPYWLYKGVTLA